MKEFKVGDMVYCPRLGSKVYTLEEVKDPVGSYTLRISYENGDLYFSPEDEYRIFHANEKNRVLLNQLYDFYFEIEKR